MPTRIDYYRVNKTRSDVYLDLPISSTDAEVDKAAKAILTREGILHYTVTRVAVLPNKRIKVEVAVKP